MTCQLLVGDSLTTLRALPDAFVQTCVTSPPYFGLRSYLAADHPDKALEMGGEDTPDAFIAGLVAVFHEVRRVLRDDGTLWVNIGDSYANDAKWGGRSCGKHVTALHGDPIGRGKRHTGLKAKDLIGIPWTLAFALRADGWYLRSDIIWAKPAPMPESVTDRPTRSHEYLFLLSKRERYFYDAAAIAEDAIRPNEPRLKGNGESAVITKVRGHGTQCGTGTTRNKRDVWTVNTKPYKGSHYATFPPKLVEPCILAGSRACDIVLDPFSGSGTTGLVALSHGRSYIGIDLDVRNLALARQRIGPMLVDSVLDLEATA